jgi:PhzF family phenazine biosynthesis protein
MKTLRFKQVDVFTERPFLGNPVAVVIGADELDGATMQRIACWTNLSETTFLLKSTKADYRLRIFTPRMELPFAGHPTLGSAHAALEAGFISNNIRIRQECAAGIFELSVEDGKIFVKAPAPKITAVEPIPGIDILSAPLRIDVGAVWVVGEVAEASVLAALKPDMAAHAEYGIRHSLAGVTVFAASKEGETAMHVRSFAPAHGIAEDPVCGTGNIAVAAYLNSRNELNRFGKNYVARQGMQVGRDGRIFIRVEPDGIRLGGHAVTCVEGSLRVS